MAKERKIIEELKKNKNAVIMAHHSQPDQIKKIADYIGESFELSIKAAELETEVVVSCGSDFMAENIKIFSPAKTVLQTEIFTECQMLKKTNLIIIKTLKKIYPQAAVVCDIKSSAVIKAESDICCTAANAIKIVDSLAEEQIIFILDKNLGEYVNQKTKKEIITVGSYCPTHNEVDIKDIERIRKIYPEVPIIVSPRCKLEVIEKANYVDSFSGIINYISKSKNKSFIIGAERGLIFKLEQDNPNKKFYLLSPKLICRGMNRNKLSNIISALKNMKTVIEIEEEIRLKAEHTLSKMVFCHSAINIL